VIEGLFWVSVRREGKLTRKVVWSEWRVGGVRVRWGGARGGLRDLYINEGGGWGSRGVRVDVSPVCRPFFQPERIILPSNVRSVTEGGTRGTPERLSPSPIDTPD